ncbi:uncharacterized protein LOC135124984 [Zophobas morio]|uniref:uncharacterized protein LOC135124984 n=1 Tax=Zophobas morio TaxID=2755281 RepID=UPI003083319D
MKPTNQFPSTRSSQNTKMKTLVCLFVVTIIATSMADNFHQKMQEYSQQCKSETGISNEALSQILRPSDDPKRKEHIFCILKKAGFMNDDGDLLVDAIVAEYTQGGSNPEGIEKITKKCAVKKESPPETATHFIECVHRPRPKRYVLFRNVAAEE